MKKNNQIHFEISERKILLRVFDVFLVLLAFSALDLFFAFDYFRITLANFYWTIVLALYLNIIGTIFEMYHLPTASNRFQITRSVLLTVSVTTLLYLLTPIFTPILPSNRLQILLFYFTMLFTLLAWRYFYIAYLASNRFIKRVIFVGNSDNVKKAVLEITAIDKHYKVKGCILTNTTSTSDIDIFSIDDLERIVKEKSISEIVLVQDVNYVLDVKTYNKLFDLLEKGVIIRKYEEVFEQTTNSLPLHLSSDQLQKFFPFSRSNQNKFYQFYSRTFDIVFSVLGIGVFVILLPVVFVLNLISNKGPLFYKQERVGKNGKLFEIIKFRTMIPNAEQNGAVYATQKDKRITPFGKLLRNSRIYEIPQFINVLKGQMALIGPRPERPVFVKQIAEKNPIYQTRHVIKPGLTGWAQVNASYGENLDDSLIKLRYDLYYIKHRSLFLDVNIIIKTLSTILFFRGQ